MTLSMVNLPLMAISNTKQIFQEKWSEKKVIVAVKQGNLLGTAFHPELTADTRWYMHSPSLNYFICII